MNLSEMTGREARTINPDADLLIEAVDYIAGKGWQWKASSVTPPHIKNPYTWGWWYNPDNERKPRPAGDAGNMHIKAWDTFKAYVAQD